MFRTLVPAVAAATLVAGCITTAPEESVGQIDLALLGTSTSGAQYRLRDAVIGVAGAGTSATFFTEDDPNRTAITTPLPTGAYTLQLGGMWRLERLEGGMPTPVTATLLSTNPQSLQINPDALTRVALRFRVPGEDVEMGEGDLEIGVEVEDTPADGGVQSILTDTTAIAVAEGGAASFGVRLAQPVPPGSTFSVNVVAGFGVAVSPSVLTFHAMDWNAPHVVTVTGDQDIDVTDRPSLVLLQAPGLESIVTVTVVDDDVLGVVTPTPSLTAPEGGSVAALFHLTHQPAFDTPVTITVSDPSRLATSTASLVFTPGAWNVPQQVVLQAVPDSDTVDNLVTVTASIAGGPSTSVQVLIDDATQEITLGWPQMLPSQTQFPGGRAIAYRVSSPVPFQVQRYQLFATGSGQVAMGIYDGGNMPSQLRPSSVVQFSLASGTIDTPTSIMLPTPIFLPAGTYWLAIGISNSVTLRSGDSSPAPRRCEVSGTGGSLPDSFPPIITSCQDNQPAANLAAFGVP